MRVLVQRLNPKGMKLSPIPSKLFPKKSCLLDNFFGYLSHKNFFDGVYMPISKKRVIKSLENLSDDLRDLMREQYPNGYESSITRITNAKKEPIFVFPLETEDATYLIKVPATKNSDGEYDVEANPVAEFEKDAVGDDDDTYGTDDEYASGEERDDYEEDGGGQKRREASYDPDFDN